MKDLRNTNIQKFGNKMLRNGKDGRNADGDHDDDDDDDDDGNGDNGDDDDDDDDNDSDDIKNSLVRRFKILFGDPDFSCP